jgi:hypothetical integral membrane protein (TIGR02206 family)
MLAGNKLWALHLANTRLNLAWTEKLPMHLCDWAVFLVLVALWSRQRLCREIAYYWGLAGTMQGMLTPDLHFDFPDSFFMTFFLSHAGIVLAVGLLVFGDGFRPTWRGLWQAYGALLFYGACAAFVNRGLDTNYGYLCRKPATASLLDHLGPWPWYVAGIAAVAWLQFVLWWLPVGLSGRVRLRATLPSLRR